MLKSKLKLRIRRPQPAHRSARRAIATVGCAVVLPVSAPAIGQAEEANPNNYSCFGSLSAGTPEAGNEDQQVAYSFHCNGPITGYQLESQIPITGVEAAPVVSNIPSGTPLTDTFSCSGEVPGYADNCVGATRGQYETIAGQFSIGSRLCAEPRVDALLTVTYAYLEKGVVTQAISGPFDLGRPTSCRPDGDSGFTRLNPKPLATPAGRSHRQNGKGHQHGRRHHPARPAHRRPTI